MIINTLESDGNQLVRTVRNLSRFYIASVDRQSPAWEGGLRAGDMVVSLNGERPRDELDLQFLAACGALRIAFARRGKSGIANVRRRPGEFLGIRYRPRPIWRCRNKCVFCFIDQMPKGMRKTLYIKDEDLVHSFLNGNYVTLSTVPNRELRRIGELGVSPLYVSVHATGRKVRNRLLGNPSAPGILGQLRALASHGITFHTQIVVCPGINDGAVLVRTLEDLVGLGRSLASVAVVPVGVTRYRKTPLRTVDTECATSVCSIVQRIGAKDAARTGGPRLFLADEFFIMAARPVPARSYYGEFPQIENGVGLVRCLLDEWRREKVKIARQVRNQKPQTGTCSGKTVSEALVLTSESAFPFIEKIVRELGTFTRDWTLHVEPVRNAFLGATVTVAGLLTARDIVRTVRMSRRRWDVVVVPDVVYNFRGYTLDGYSAKRTEKSIGTRLVVASSVAGLVEHFAGEAGG